MCGSVWPSLRNLRLVPLDVRGNGNYKIRLRGQRLAVLVLFGLRGGDNPHIAVVIAAEFALRIRTVDIGRKQALVVEAAYKFFVVVTEYRIEFFDRPGDS